MSEQKNPQQQTEQELSQQAAVRRQKLADMKAATADLIDIYKGKLVDAGIDADAVMAVVEKYVD